MNAFWPNGSSEKKKNPKKTEDMLGLGFLS